MPTRMLAAEELRREFDAAFAAPPRARDDTLEPLLLIAVTPDRRVALRMAGLGGVHVCPPIVRLPGGVSPQLGVVGLRGRLAAAFCLPAALGLEPPARPGRWIALLSDDRSIGFVFHALEGHMLAGRGQIRRANRANDPMHGDAPRAADALHADTVVELDSGLVPLVELDALAAPLRAAAADRVLS